MTLVSGKAQRSSSEPRATDAWASSDAFVIRSAPGLAAFLIKEMKWRRLGRAGQPLTVLFQRNYDLVFGRGLDIGKVSKLRIAEDVYRCPVYGRYKISKSQLSAMATALKSSDHPWRLAAAVAGQHFRRHELAQWVAKELSARGAAVYVEADATVAWERVAWLFCVDEAYYFCLPVVRARDLPDRQRRVVERKGSLPPPVAAAMAFAGQVSDEDVIVDPVCGSGTLLAEAHGYAPGARLVGIDVDATAVEMARQNLSHIGPNVRIMTGNAARMDLPDGFASVFLANLPFGKQYGSRKDNPALYRDILEECRRVGVAREWRAVLVTSDVGSLENALRRLPRVRSDEVFRVTVLGEAARAYLVRPA